MIRAAVFAVLLGCGGRSAAPPPPRQPVEKSVQVNAPGERVDPARLAPAGYVTVVDFWSETCGACTVVGGMLAVQVAKEPDVVIRKIDVGDGFTPVAKQYDIGALPHYNVYDKRQKLRYVLVGNDCLKAPEIAKQLAAE